MLENQIQELINALNNNTAAQLAVLGQQPASQVIENDEPDDEADVEEEEVEEEVKPAKKSRAKAAKAKKPAVTLDQCKELSSELADAGTLTVKETRAKINALGYNLMKEMADEDLAELYNWLLGVKAEADLNDNEDNEDEEDEDL